MLSAPEGRADSRPPQAAATVADVMRLAAETVAEGDHVAAATYLMQHASATSLLVTDFQAGKPVGVITAADIARAVADGRDHNEIRIYHLLTTRPAPISAATPVRDAAEATLTGGFRQLPVSGDGDLIGIVDLTDLVGALPSPPPLTTPAGRRRPASDPAAITPGQSIRARCLVSGTVPSAAGLPSARPPASGETSSRGRGAETGGTVPDHRQNDATSAARIVAAADETRRRLERDLHDGIQQSLVSLGLKAQMIQTMTPRPADKIQRELSLLADGLFTALDELREISHGIHPAVLSEAGLGPALEALARRSAVPAELHLNLGPPLGQHAEMAAYYIASEALANAAKHAQASVIDLRVHGDDSALTLSVRDDGIGGADPSRGTGITGLKDRIEALGGTISVLSPPGHGTTLHVRLPADPSAVARADGGWREDTVTDVGSYPAARERRLSSGLPMATAPRKLARGFGARSSL